MKIEITLNQETLTESGRVIPSGVYVAEYNEMNGIHGYDSGDMDRYDALRLNERLITRAVIDANNNDNGQQILTGNGIFKEKKCSVVLYTVR